MKVRKIDRWKCAKKFGVFNQKFSMLTLKKRKYRRLFQLRQEWTWSWSTCISRNEYAHARRGCADMLYGMDDISILAKFQRLNRVKRFRWENENIILLGFIQVRIDSVRYGLACLWTLKIKVYSLSNFQSLFPSVYFYF